MKYAIVFSSQSGNTRQVAEAAFKALPNEDCVYYGGVSEAAISEADLIFAGFWTDKGTCDEQMKAFLNGLEHKRVALFGTAGFGSGEYFDKILKRVSSNLPDSATLEGGFMCQGRMPLSVRQQYEKMALEKPMDEHIQGMINNFDAASTHPDEADFAGVRDFVRKLL